MRLGVLDVGSNTVHLLVLEAHRGAHPWPAYSEKSVLRLAEHIGADGKLSHDAAETLIDAVAKARKAAEEHEVQDMLAFATSAVRDATNSAKVLARVRFSSSSSVKNAPCEQHPSLARPSMMPWQPRPKMHVQRDRSHVMSARTTWSGFAGSLNSNHSRGKSSDTSRLRGLSSSVGPIVICTGTSSRRRARRLLIG